MSVTLSRSAYQRAVRAEHRRNPRPLEGEAVVIPLPPVRRAPFTGSAGL